MSKKHAHHGGAWKVAYADFVTAMMALFLVLWLTAQDVHIKEAVQRAFKNPFMSVTKESTGIIPSKNKDTSQAVQSTAGAFSSASAMELAMLRRINEDLAKALQGKQDDEKNSVELKLNSDGLRISIFDRSRKPIFAADSTKFTPYGDWVFSTLSWEISRYGNFLIELEGHTEKGRLPVRANYDDWFLSADRANAARVKLVEHGVRAGQIRKVAGFADTVTMEDAVPEDEINRRVSVLLKVKTESRL